MHFTVLSVSGNDYESTSYSGDLNSVGSGKLTGKVALITGGDSGYMSGQILIVNGGTIFNG